LSLSNEPNLKNTVWIRKVAIKEGLIAEIEDLQKGATGFYMVLGALVNEETKFIETTYKELEKLTGFSRATITKLIEKFHNMNLIKKLSKRGSRKTIFWLV